MLADGRLLKATGTGGSGTNMFNLQEVDGTFRTGPTPSTRSSSSARRTSPAASPAWRWSGALIGFADGRLLKVIGTGGSGANMFNLVDNGPGQEFAHSQNQYTQQVEGSQVFPSGVAGVYPIPEGLFVALADGRLLKATGTGGSGTNMFNLQEVDGTFLTGADPQYQVQLIGSQNFTGRVTCLEVVGGRTLIGFADGRLLKVIGTGGSGANMFNLSTTGRVRSCASPRINTRSRWEGSQVFPSGVAGVYPIPEGLFVALADGRLLKVTGTGGSGTNMFNLQEVDGTFLTGADPQYHVQLIGSQNFTGRVTCLEVVGVRTLIGFADGRLLKVIGTGGSGANMFNLSTTGRARSSRIPRTNTRSRWRGARCSRPELRGSTRSRRGCSWPWPTAGC